MSERSDVHGSVPGTGEVVVNVVEYDPRWPGRFEREAARIREALGRRVSRVEHVGSTSVPGLAAKPVIDIVLAVSDSSDESRYLPELEAAGYFLYAREPDWFEHRLLKTPADDVNLHVFTLGASEIDRMVALRDHLRQNASDRRRYATVKRELAQRRWRTVDDYAQAKNDVVELMHRNMTG
ncbi:GrpB family protein [Streptomyces carpaticus]|uniref:GrpB family protein n=1 Tax=Streptomyces carpaticus TaxID=285558 RepID=A0ABV4ZQG5_9ACTN